jgi:hypothetical protein
MPRKPDVKKAVKAVTAAGIGVMRVEIEPSGKIIITTGTGESVVSLGETPEDVKRLL